LIQEAGRAGGVWQAAEDDRPVARWNLPPMPGKKKRSNPFNQSSKPACTCGTNPGARGWWVDVRIQDNEERVDVFFDSVGFKRLLASLAKLEIVEEIDFNSSIARSKET